MCVVPRSLAQGFTEQLLCAGHCSERFTDTRTFIVLPTVLRSPPSPSALVGSPAFSEGSVPQAAALQVVPAPCPPAGFWQREAPGRDQRVADS